MVVGMSFAKLDGGIVDSTLWMQPHDVLRVWIAMLAKCDNVGVIRASVPAFAHLCMVPIERLELILAILTSPDPYSRTPDNDGRRLEVIDGGWLIVNYVKYRELMQTKPQSHAERQKRYRDRLAKRDAAVTRDGKCEINVTSDAKGEGEGKVKEDALRASVGEHADAPAETEDSQAEPTDAGSRAGIPVARIVDLYHERLPELPRVEKLTRARRGYIQQRWREDLPSLDSWENFFADVRKSSFLMGKANAMNGKPPFLASLDWITRPENFAKIAEGKYHRG